MTHQRHHNQARHRRRCAVGRDNAVLIPAGEQVKAVAPPSGMPEKGCSRGAVIGKRHIRRYRRAAAG